MIERTSIIFQLNNELTVHSISHLVNPTNGLKTLSIQHIETIEKTSRVLNLGNFLEQKWQLWWQNNAFAKASEIIFITGSEAGFTDARMLYVWLKTWQDFSLEHTELIIVTAPATNLENISSEELLNLLSYWKKISTPTLNYSKAPRIG